MSVQKCGALDMTKDKKLFASLLEASSKSYNNEVMTMMMNSFL